MSSPSSGGEHDSTGLRAAVNLNTPLSRCVSPRNTRAVRRRFRDDKVNCKREAYGLPVLRFTKTELKKEEFLRYSSYGALLAVLCLWWPSPQIKACFCIVDWATDRTS